jgi:uncharacterized membrane protein
MNDSGQVIRVRQSVTINRSTRELYDYWRDFENLPRIMRHLSEVRILDSRRSHWVVAGPLDTPLEWDAEITEETSGNWISWRSLPDSRIPNEGWVAFSPAPAGQGSEVHVHLAYRPPLGRIGAAFAKLLGKEPSQQIREDLRRFQQQMETGEVATTRGQPSGRRS